VYTTPPLEADLEVTGPVSVTLYAATDAPDTDFTARLVDVFPDGYAMNVAQGIIRARYRDSWERPTLLEPGRVCRYTLDLWSTSNCFLRGHRMRVEISSSNFPQFDRNPNTGNPFGLDAELRTAIQTVYHDADRPSHILLPIIPA
jgi:putative CocE/NonD family hydrolase